MKIVAAALAALLPLAAHGHGLMTYPLSRNGGDPNSGGIGGDAANYCENQKTIPGQPTINDRELLTVNPDKPPDYDTSKNPWRAAGSAPITYPCGELGGRDGRYDLPPRQGGVLTVSAGGSLNVAWAINANHGGGYTYRLCKKDSSLSEQCFQNNTLAFVGDSWIEKGLNGPRTYLPPVRTTQGTFPAGSQWTKNPIPFRYDDFPNPRPQWMQQIGLGSGDGYGAFDWSVWDTVKIPSNMSDGEYLLSFRWDCEYTQQVWLNCGDIVVGRASPTAPPSPTPAPPPPPTDSCEVSLQNRKECGYYGINEQECLSRACCWKPDYSGSNAPWCFNRVN